MYPLYEAVIAYGTLNLTESSPAQGFTEVFTPDDVKGHLGIEIEDETYDDQLLGLILAARSQAEVEQNRDLVRKQWDLSLDYWPPCRVDLRSPLISVDLVRYRDSNGDYTTLAAEQDYVVDVTKQPGGIVPPYNQPWPTFAPWPSSALLIRFTSGFAADAAWWVNAGARVKIGMKMLITGWFQQRIPFTVGPNAATEYPYGISTLLRTGAVTRVK